jgi:hypothetical protein
VIPFVKVQHFKVLGYIFNSERLSHDPGPAGKVVTDLWPGASLLSSVRGSASSYFPNVLICPRKWRGAGFPSHHILVLRLLLPLRARKRLSLSVSNSD